MIPNFDQDGVFLGTFESETKSDGGGIGFHGGLGIELGLTPQLGLLIEIKGRYASFSNFEGTYEIDSYSEKGKLWAFDSDNNTLIEVAEDKPTGVDNVHQAKVDFSGFSALIGFVFWF